MAATGSQFFVCFGNLGQDPELRHTQSGTAILSLRIAVTESRKKGDSYEDQTQWFSAVVWGKRGEGLSRILKKGDKVQLMGRIEQRQWEDKEGNRRESFEIVCSEVTLGGGGRQRSDSYPMGEPSGGGDFDDNIPFGP